MRVRYDATAIAGLDDPYPAYAALREAGPVVPAGPGVWAVTGHTDVTALLADPRVGHEFPDVVYQASGEPDAVTGFFRATVLNRDAPVHTVLRRAMSRLLAPRAVAGLRGRVDELVGELFTAMDGDADLVTGLAAPLPVTVAAELLGIPVADRDLVRPYAMTLARAFGAGIRVEGDRDATAAAVTWLRAYVRELLAERERRGRDDDPLAGLLATADPGGAITAEALVDNVIFLFFAGFDTTTNLIATGCAALLSRPDVLARLRAEPELVPSAVEEFLRFDAPIQATARLTRAPIEVSGRRINANRLVVLLLAAANRDGRRFARPDELDITRTPNPHVSFSAGPHFCLGATLARLEGAAVFDRIARGLAGFEPAGVPVRRRHMSFRGYDHLPARVRLGAFPG
ncbi:cytochrome P450 [Micromonospora aurantiaca]|uniref:cytochrome P450 n=1 Tax=Micromonospora aurantiaca (nom. illeg.) TaxID=47850 RepID=UPI003799E672